ncbi:uncharacterized protein LOC132644436 [Lycium barbarum]|uniref:uncharacterized protein LOC132644436 n=1 Tax=Lycium barbarum TaxID=112863 RepID=UPI00293F2F93|nr:uncharacterized protein LOC132644436 [Lycium barbarum]
MALSSPRAPPDPNSAATTRPIFSTNPILRPPTPQPFSLQSSQRLPPPPPNPNYSPFVPKSTTTTTNPDPQSHLYPLASAGRGFLPHPNRPVVPFGLNHMDPGSDQAAGTGGRPTHLQHALLGSSSPATSSAVKGFPVVTSSHPKIASTQPSISDCNGFRDRSKDDTFAIIRDRKVRISDNASLYALCRSWLRNGLPDETQSQYMDGVRSLPRPLPLAPQDAESPVKKDGDKEEEEEDGESVEHLSRKELLQRHVKRAKRIRSRLREERLRRIARYKTRLALLLPPMVEQQFRNDPASGN